MLPCEIEHFGTFIKYLHYFNGKIIILCISPQGVDVLSNEPFQLELSSRECEQQFGMHPFSMSGRLIYLSVIILSFELDNHLNNILHAQKIFDSNKQSSFDSAIKVTTDPDLILGDKFSFAKKVIIHKRL